MLNFGEKHVLKKVRLSAGFRPQSELLVLLNKKKGAARFSAHSSGGLLFSDRHSMVLVYRFCSCHSFFRGFTSQHRAGGKTCIQGERKASNSGNAFYGDENDFVTRGSYLRMQHSDRIADCYLRRGDGGTTIAHFGSRICFLR